MDDTIKKLVEGIREAGRRVKDDTAYLDDREDRLMGHAIGEAFGSLASTIEQKFATTESDIAAEAHRDGRYCGRWQCTHCNTFPVPPEV